MHLEKQIIFSLLFSHSSKSAENRRSSKTVDCFIILMLFFYPPTKKEDSIYRFHGTSEKRERKHKRDGVK